MKKILILFVFCVFCTVAFSQSITIKKLKNDTILCFDDTSEILNNSQFTLMISKSLNVDSVLTKDHYGKFFNEKTKSDSEGGIDFNYYEINCKEENISNNMLEIKLKTITDFCIIYIEMKKVKQEEIGNTSGTFFLKETLYQYLKNSTVYLTKKDTVLIEKLLHGDRYFSRENLAYIIFDKNGNLIGNMPVNLDQDDRIKILTLADNNSNISIDVDGEYRPQYLTVVYKDTTAISSSNKPNKSELTVLENEIGPFTSEKFNLTFKNGSITKTYQIRINKLYHAAFGTAVILTTVPNYSFGVFPLTDSENTIKHKNQSSVEPMLSFNVTWFWHNTFKYFCKGSDLIRGRDIMKEPSWYQRINPTFGLAMDKEGKIFDNVFLGLNFEFARGGSFTGGVHLRKTQQLALKKTDGTDFELGKSVFNGTEDNITTIDDWKWGFFFGIALDTRIFEKLKK